MRKRLRRLVPLEALDSRMLPSTMMVNPPTAQVSPSAHSKPVTGGLHIQGNVSGTFQSNGASIADAPDRFSLSGSGPLQCRARRQVSPHTTQVTGSLYGTGFIMTGHSTGSLVLTTSAGQVTLDLTGPKQNGFQPPASQFRYVVRNHSGTGSFANAQGAGIVKLELATTSKPDSLQSGNFRLRFI